MRGLPQFPDLDRSLSRFQASRPSSGYLRPPQLLSCILHTQVCWLRVKYGAGVVGVSPAGQEADLPR